MVVRVVAGGAMVEQATADKMDEGRSNAGKAIPSETTLNKATLSKATASKTTMSKTTMSEILTEDKSNAANRQTRAPSNSHKPPRSTP